MDTLLMIRSNLFYYRFISGRAHVSFHNTAVKGPELYSEGAKIMIYIISALKVIKGRLPHILTIYYRNTTK